MWGLMTQVVMMGPRMKDKRKRFFTKRRYVSSVFHFFSFLELLYMVGPFDIGITVSKKEQLINGKNLAQYLLDSLWTSTCLQSVVCNERSNVFESADEDIVSIHCKLRCNQRLVLKGAGFHLPSNLLELKLDSHQAVCLKRSSAWTCQSSILLPEHGPQVQHTAQGSWS